MELFKKHTHQIIFWSGMVIILILTVTALVTAYLNRTKTVDDTKSNKSEELVLTDTEVTKAKNTSSVAGRVTAVTPESITLNDNAGKAYTLKITKTSAITKGIDSATANLTELAIGNLVSVAYLIDTQEVINLWWEGK